MQAHPTDKRISCLELFTVFFRIGLFSVGGGYAMLPMLKRELVENKKWLNNSELVDFYAIGQSTPGIIAINTATFAGYKKAGVAGALASTLAMVTPSLLIITVLAAFFANFQDLDFVQRAFKGIRVGVCVSLTFTLYSLLCSSIKNLTGIALSTFACCAVMFLNLSPVLIIFSAGIYGWLFTQRGKKL